MPLWPSFHKIITLIKKIQIIHLFKPQTLHNNNNNNNNIFSSPHISTYYSNYHANLKKLGNGPEGSIMKPLTGRRHNSEWYFFIFERVHPSSCASNSTILMPVSCSSSYFLDISRVVLSRLELSLAATHTQACWDGPHQPRLTKLVRSVPQGRQGWWWNSMVLI